MKRILIFVSLLFINPGLRAQDAPAAIHVEVRGTGDPVLLLPGFSCPGAVWEETVRELERDYQCHIVTYAGFGGAPPIEFPWLPRVREELEDYLIARGLTKARLVGHSMGGTLALWLGTSRELNLKSIVVVDGLPAMGALMIPNYDSAKIAYESPWNKQMLEMAPSAFEAMATGMAAGMAADLAHQQQIARWILEADRKTYVYGYTDLLKLDLRPDLNQIGAPVYILAASRPFGEEVARKNYVAQFEGLEDYTLDFAPDAGHFIMYDQPEWFVRTLRDILN
ncbi:alpha/beta fold hydrolase [Robiginitalea sediminis]|uniref:alpha/beta fold hydrolase n=1 Tax=Robiginitalea sediminis TaxID=1982593 RepID=UPI000B4BDF97|nr:alpha/beta hydrolase [Robiginitalea sediminis]